MPQQRWPNDGTYKKLDHIKASVIKEGLKEGTLKRTEKSY